MEGQPITLGPTPTNRQYRAAATPTFPPPLRVNQKRSAWWLASTCTTTPSASTIAAASRKSQVSLTSAGLPSIAPNNTVAIAKYNAAGQLIQMYPQHNAANIAQVIGSLVNETFVPTGHYSIPQA